ncbi:FAD-dependent oxidoreductase [Streptomyces pacificus]|uniref:FAD-dependent oxidoreductase n=1 Tax=Streptomyces pacificus TaxID=2705029 RepID=A0A6A0B2U3_9ACTN|nr:FAD-dependent oxidoreductase [Streptomyces pacificus]
MVVAGGGIGGLAAAAGLAVRGIDVTVVERAGRIGACGTALVIHSRGMRAADALSERLGGRIRAVAPLTGPGEIHVLMDSGGTVLAEEQTGAAAEAPQVPVLRSALHRVLLDEALAAGAAVRLATAVTDYTPVGDSVTVRLSDGETLDSEALVGADGTHSAVRARMLGDGPPRYRGYTSVEGCTRGSALGHRRLVVDGRGIRLLIAPVSGDTLYWNAEITAPPGVWPALGAAGAQRALLEALDGWYGPVVDLVADAGPGDLVITDIHHRDPAPRWVDGRVVLLGDAAHPMLTALGQGADMALEDAAALADVLASSAEIPGALVAYAAERMDRTAAVLASRRQGVLERGVERRDAQTKPAGRRDAALADVLGRRPRPRRPAGTGAPGPTTTALTEKRDIAMRSPHIVLISGSLRSGSTSDQVAQWCARRCAEQGATTRVFTGAEIDFPAYRPGLAGTHEGAAALLGELRAADGVILVSPTYHASVSGLLKNALDYVNDIGGPLPYLEGRAIGTVAVGTGVQGAVSTLATLRTVGHALRGWPTPVGVAVAQVPAEPSAGGAEPGGDAARLVEMVSQAVWLGGVRSAARTPLLGAVA